MNFTGLSRFISSRLERRLIFSILPALIFAFAIVVGIIVLSQVTLLRTTLQQAQEVKLGENVEEIDDILQDVESDVTFLQKVESSIALATALNDGDNTAIATHRRTSEQLFISLVEANDIYKSIRYLDITGQEIIHVSSEFLEDGTKSVFLVRNLIDQSDVNYFQDAMAIGLVDQSYATNITLASDKLSRNIIEPVMTYSRPVFRVNADTAQRRPLAALAITLYAENVLEPVSPELIGEEAFIATIPDEQTEAYFLYNSDAPEQEWGFVSGINEIVVKSPAIPAIDDESEQVAQLNYSGTDATLNNFLGDAPTTAIMNAGSAITGDFVQSAQGEQLALNYTRYTPTGASYSWFIGTAFNEATLFQPLNRTIQAVLLVVFIVVGAVIALIYSIARQISRPIGLVSERAGQIAAGQYTQSTEAIDANRSDEIGDLNRAFNTMATQLQEFVGDLEEKVASRTANLETASEIATSAARIQDFDDLISLTVNLIRDRFNFYYVQIYLLDESRNVAVLKDGTGFVGRQLLSQQHRLPLDGQSLVALAVNNKHYVLVEDTLTDPNFLPNVLLSETRTELVIPMHSQDRLIGVLDIQHNEPGAFDSQSIVLFTTMAEQLSITARNIQLLDESLQRASDMATVAEVSVQASTSLDFSTLLRTITRLTRRNFDLYHVHIYLLDETKERLVLAAGSGEAGVIMMEEEHSISLDHPASLVAHVARTRENLLVNDVSQAVDFLRNVHLPDTRSEMALPIIYGDELLGVLDIQDDKTDQFDESTMQVQTTLANQIAVAIVNARTFEAADSSRRFLSLITDAIPDWIFAKDRNFRFLFVNKSFAQAFGLMPEDFIGKDEIEMGLSEEEIFGSTEKGIVGFRHDDIKVITTGEEVHNPYNPVTRNGVTAIFNTSKLPLYNASNEIIGVLGIAHDITKQQQTQDEISRRAEEASIITRISTEIAAQLDVDNLLQSVVDAVSNNLQHYHAHIYLLNKSQSTLVLAAGSGDIGTRMVNAGHQLALNVDSLVTRAARTQETIVVSNVFIQPDYLPSPDLPQTHAEIAIPLLYGTELLGVLDILDDRVREYTTVEVQTRQTLANQVAIGIKNAFIFEEISRYAEEANIITELSSEITSQLSVDDLLWRVANITKEKFNRYHTNIYLLNAEHNTLVLVAGSDTVGQLMVEEGHSIRISADSLVARAARTAQPVVADNTSQQGDFLPNPHLPLTRAEMAIPLLYGGQVLGVLDIQDDKVEKFAETEIQTQQTLANQVAIAINNARSFERLQESQEQLAKNEERLNAALEGSSDGLWDWNLITNDVYLSPRWKLLLGYRDDELKNALDTWEQLLHPDDNEMAHTAITAHLENPDETPYEVEFRMQHKDGSYRWILSRGAVRLNEAGQQERLVGTHADITERKEAEAEREILFEASQKLASATTTDDVFAAIRHYAESLGAESGTLFYITLDDRNKPEWAIAHSVWDKYKEPAVPLGTRFYLPDFAFSNLWLSNPDTATLINDMQIDPSVDENTRKVYSDLGIHGAALLPLYYQRRWVGVITLNWQEATTFTDTDFRIFGELIRQSTVQIDAIRTANEVAIARQRAEVLAAMNEQLSQAGDETDIVMVLANYTQYAKPDEIVLSYIESDTRNHPVFAEAIVAWRDGAINTQYPSLGQKFRLSDFQFAQNWIQNPHVPLIIEDIENDNRIDEDTREIFRLTDTAATIILPQYSNGRWQGILSFTWATPQDFNENDLYIYQNIIVSLSAVIASRRDYLASQQAATEASMLYNITSQINSAESAGSLLDAIIEQSVIPDVSSVSINLFDGNDMNDASAVHVVADWNRDGDSLRGVMIPLEQMPFIQHFTPNALNISENIYESNLDELSLATLEALNIFAYICVPLVIGQRWLGLINFYNDSATQYTPTQKRILSRLAQQISAAIERLNLLTQTQLHASELETVARLSAATTTITDVDELLGTVVELTKTNFNLYHSHIYLVDETGETLVMAAGAGEAGQMMKEQGHAIPMNRVNSLVARAARTREAVISNDIMEAVSFMPNPYLPDTRSELALPMVVGQTLIGVLDMQSDEVGHFAGDEVRVKASLADQLAIAVQNAIAFERERRTVERLKEVDRLKQEFLANMSHELRTPLNSIIGYSEVLLDGVDGDLTEDAIEDVDAIYTSGKHLLNIINEILDLAKIEAGQMQLRMTEMDLLALLKDVVRSSQILVKDKPVEMHLIEDSPIKHVMGDQVRLNQIMLNLVSNAIKFTEEGTVNIRYGMMDDGEMLYVRVEDSGIGMTPEDIAVIFQRFRQADGSSTRRAGGTGLGLTITRQLIQMHGGDIDVESDYGNGSTFWFTIPVIQETESSTVEQSIDEKIENPA